MAKKVKLPADPDKRVKSILDVTGETGDIAKPSTDEVKAAAAVLGRKGGLKGGNARAAKLSAKRRSDIAKKAAKVRWHKANQVSL